LSAFCDIRFHQYIQTVVSGNLSSLQFFTALQFVNRPLLLILSFVNLFCCGLDFAAQQPRSFIQAPAAVPILFAQTTRRKYHSKICVNTY